MNKKQSSFLIILVFLITMGFFVSRNAAEMKKGEIQAVNIGGKDIKVELARTPEEQALGLSGRKGLAADAGMLFVFPQPGKYYFWMKDMDFAIDMIWMSQDLHVVYIKKNAKPEDFPETSGPDEDAKYVLEVNSGFSDKNNLKVGDSAVFSY